MASFLEISNCHKNRFGKVSPCVCIESVILIIYPQSVLLCLMSDDFSENLFPPTKNLLTNIFLRILFKSIASQTNFTYTTTLSTSLIVTYYLYSFPQEKEKKKKSPHSSTQIRNLLASQCNPFVPVDIPCHS